MTIRVLDPRLDPEGEPLALVRAAAEPSQRATLEEIVLGYLATPTARSPIPDAR